METTSQFENQNIAFDPIREKVQSIVTESVLPTNEGLGFESTVGIYGGKLVWESDGKVVYDTTGVISQGDKIGDAVLRTYDEHLAQRPWKVIKHALRHPIGHRRLFTRILFPGTLRYRGTPSEIAANAIRLGLGEYYGLHSKGIEIKKQEVFTKGRALQDIYRQQSIEHAEALQGIDRFQALSSASSYIREIHDKYGAIGELVASDIIFQEREGDRVTDPVLNIPDEVYNSGKSVSENYKKATDLLDFLINIGFEEFRRSNNWTEVERALQTIVTSYGESSVLSAVESFARRGKLTMSGENRILRGGDTKTRQPFVLHNKARLSFDPKYVYKMRQEIIKVCAGFKANPPSIQVNFAERINQSK